LFSNNSEKEHRRRNTEFLTTDTCRLNRGKGHRNSLCLCTGSSFAELIANWPNVEEDTTYFVVLFAIAVVWIVVGATTISAGTIAFNCLYIGRLQVAVIATFVAGINFKPIMAKQ